MLSSTIAFLAFKELSPFSISSSHSALSKSNDPLEYGSEVWEGNKSQTAALESVMLGGAKRILGCSSKTCNEAVRGDMGLETLQGRRDKSKLKVWYKLASMSEDRYIS